MGDLSERERKRYCSFPFTAKLDAMVGRCRLTVSKLVLKPPMASALETIISINFFQRLL